MEENRAWIEEATSISEQLQCQPCCWLSTAPLCSLLTNTEQHLPFSFPNPAVGSEAAEGGVSEGDGQTCQNKQARAFLRHHPADARPCWALLLEVREGTPRAGLVLLELLAVQRQWENNVGV